MKHPLFLLILLFLTLPAQADRIVGNGGDILVCENKQQKSYLLLDLYEAEELHEMKVQYPNASSSLQEIIGSVLKRLAFLSPQRVKTYSRWAEEFLQEASFKENVQLVDIDDSEHLFIPTNCRLEQIAIQRSDKQKGPRYVVNKNLWDSADIYQKAALVIHEVIYREYIELHGPEKLDSQAVRYFNALLWSDKISSYQLESFWQLMQELRFEYVEYHGVLVKVYSPEDELNDEMEWDPTTWDSGAIYSTRVVDQQLFSLGGINFFLADRPEFIPWRDTIWFYESGPVYKITIDASKVNIHGYLLFIFGTVEFYESGAIKVVNLVNEQTITYNDKTFKVSGPLHFSEDGTPIL